MNKLSDFAVCIIHHRKENILMPVFVKNLLGISLMGLPERGISLPNLTVKSNLGDKLCVPWNRRPGCFKEEE